MIISFSKNLRYYVYHQATDMRKGFDSLGGLVNREFNMSPISGDVFIFLNRQHNRIKVLHWQGDGFAIFYKRLEKGTYEVPLKNTASQNCSLGEQSPTIEIQAQTLQLILEGISLSSVRKRKRYEQNMV
jgi:transposase